MGAALKDDISPPRLIAWWRSAADWLAKPRVTIAQPSDGS